MKYNEKDQALRFIATMQAYRWNLSENYSNEPSFKNGLYNAMFDAQDTIIYYVADKFFGGSYLDTVHTIDDMIHYDGTQFVVTC